MKALIFGVTGQAGSYLADFLLEKNYSIVGVARRVSTPNTSRISHLLANPNFKLVHGDVTDPVSVYRVLDEACPDQIFSLAAMSFVAPSFNEPLHSMSVTACGVIPILEWMRGKDVRLFHASSSEMYGRSFSIRGHSGIVQHMIWSDDPTKVRYMDGFQNEGTLFLPNSPYAIAKLAAHHMIRLYRESYGVHASAGILFNYESPRRGEEFVTRKITKYVANLAKDMRDSLLTPKLKLGNIESYRDWMHCKDAVRGMWLTLQNQPDDYVLCTGTTHSVKSFLERAFNLIGVDYSGYIEIDKTLFRPNEVPYLRGDATKAKEKLGWVPSISFEDLVQDMMRSDLNAVGITNENIKS